MLSNPSSSRSRRTVVAVFDVLDEDVVPQLRHQFPNASIFLLTTSHPGTAGQAIGPREIASALEAWAGSAETPHLAPLLTPRQQDILALIAQGKSNKEIARVLSISPFTVRNHVSLLLRVLNVATRGHAAAKAGDSNPISVPSL